MSKITKLALEAGLLAYVEHETPREYYINCYADLDQIKKLARLIIGECEQFMYGEEIAQVLRTLDISDKNE